MSRQAKHEPLWWVVIPMKRLDRAKSRLRCPGPCRRHLVVAMVQDTLDAVVSARAVAGALVVCQRDEDVESLALPGVRVVVRPDLAINDAVSFGAALLRAEAPTVDVAALPGDLPHLRSSELDVALRYASSHPRAVVGDQMGEGTTLLTARTGVELAPAYGTRSLRRHTATGASEVSMPTWSGVRRDVDTLDDLVPGTTLGYRTSAAIDLISAREVLA